MITFLSESEMNRLDTATEILSHVWTWEVVQRPNSTAWSEEAKVLTLWKDCKVGLENTARSYVVPMWWLQGSPVKRGICSFREKMAQSLTQSHSPEISPERFRFLKMYKEEKWYDGPLVPRDENKPRCDQCGNTATWVIKTPLGNPMYNCYDCKKALGLPAKEWQSLMKFYTKGSLTVKEPASFQNNSRGLPSSSHQRGFPKLNWGIHKYRKARFSLYNS